MHCVARSVYLFSRVLIVELFANVSSNMPFRAGTYERLNEDS